MQKTTALVAAVIAVGILGGWAFLATQAIPVAHAQVSGGCKPGQACKASSFTASSSTSPVVVPSGGKVCLNGSTCTSSLYWSGSNTTLQTGTGGFTLDGVSFTVNGGGVQAGIYTSINSTNPTDIRSNRSAASTTSVAPAIQIKPSNALDADDLVLGVQTSAGSSLLAIDVEGDAVSAGRGSFKGTIVLRSEDVSELPTCGGELRGMHAVFPDEFGADQVCWCLYDGVSAYAWENRTGGACGT